MTRRQTKTVTFHQSILVEEAIAQVKAGLNPIFSTKKRTLQILADYQAMGIAYYTGCDKEDVDGRCRGHQNYENK